MAKKEGIHLLEGQHYKKDVFAWIPGLPGNQSVIAPLTIFVQPHCIRAHYYAGVTGDDDLVMATKRSLWEMQFSLQVFKKAARGKSKGSFMNCVLRRELKPR